ncbi:MAG: proline--tRNA ligase [Treponema sp.]|nr:proline--tRNA ligase [Treponema sp.]
MKISEAFIPTLREVPADAVIVSHRLMFRAGMIRKLSNGLFAYLPLGLRSFRKIETIVREEMDATGSLEIKPTVVVPGELWKESGRWNAYGDALMRIKNRTGADFVVSPTAEEAFTALVRDELSSYRQLPISLYQINTKYRDEVRPRYGVMRGREFMMKDAYSFHTDEKSLDETYRKMGTAYRRVFKRCALTVIPVQADSGAMGGSGSEEIMVESEIGDNTLLLCRCCTYAANVEKAGCLPDYTAQPDTDAAKAAAAGIPPIEKIDTPNVKTIEELCAFLKTDAKSFIKTLVYKAINVELDLSKTPGSMRPEKRSSAAGLPAREAQAYPEAFFAVAIRGDLDINETKLSALLKAASVELAGEDDVRRITGAPVGFAGPVGLGTVPLIADLSVTTINDGICGGLAKDLHYRHAAFGRDFNAWMVADVRTVRAGDRCPQCSGELYEKKGNELGHIFKLGSKYTDSMNVTYLDEDGKNRVTIMGCYGLGLDRTLASIIEEHHDEDGIIWPMSVAPYQVIIVPIKYEGAVKQTADSLEAALERMKVECLLDDRDERPGVKFKDADLIGIPVRIVVGEKNLAGNAPRVELKRRSEKENRLVPVSSIVDEVTGIIQAELAGLDS